MGKGDSAKGLISSDTNSKKEVSGAMVRHLEFFLDGSLEPSRVLPKDSNVVYVNPEKAG